jgi:hypothetical protein
MDCESKETFVENANLRPKAESLDALQLTLLQHWAIRDALEAIREPFPRH